MERNKVIFLSFCNMVNIAKIQGFNSVVNNSMTNIANVHTCSLTKDI